VYLIYPAENAFKRPFMIKYRFPKAIVIILLINTKNASSTSNEFDAASELAVTAFNSKEEKNNMGEEIVIFGKYKDFESHDICFSVENKLQDLTKKMDLFVPSIMKDYNLLSPQQIDKSFRTQADVINWLRKGFAREWDYFQTAKHPIHWIEIIKNEELIGFALFEQWKEDPSEWHIRQVAILYEEQHRGYGRSLVWSIKQLEKDVSKLVADTRRLNLKARDFFRSLGFNELEKPNDSELNSEIYLGLEKILEGI
jgi:ribosomal protein S18 acetylase RimI-like enzyme